MTTRTPERTRRERRGAREADAVPAGELSRRSRSRGRGREGGAASAPSDGASAGVAASPRMYRALGLLVLVGCVQALVMIGLEGWRVATAGRAIARLEVDVAELEAEAAELREVLEHGDDEAYREGLARALGWLHPDEGRVPTLRPR